MNFEGTSAIMVGASFQIFTEILHKRRNCVFKISDSVIVVFQNQNKFVDHNFLYIPAPCVFALKISLRPHAFQVGDAAGHGVERTLGLNSNLDVLRFHAGFQRRKSTSPPPGGMIARGKFHIVDVKAANGHPSARNCAWSMKPRSALI